MVQAKDAVASAAGLMKGKIQKAAWVAKEKVLCICEAK
jgi:hypothetical protein